VSLVKKNESGAHEKTHEKSLLFVLDGQGIDGYTLLLKDIKRGRFIDEKNFNLYLQKEDSKSGGDKASEISLEPIVIGTYFEGRGKYLKPWLEIFYQPVVRFKKDELDLPRENLELPIFHALSGLLPAGGRIFVIYDSRYHALTAKALERGVPAAATPLGYLLWRSGFRWFKNWYFSEGWKEGSQKLQANKPLDADHEKRQFQKLYLELKEFLSKKPLLATDYGKTSKPHAQKIIRQIKG